MRCIFFRLVSILFACLGLYSESVGQDVNLLFPYGSEKEAWLKKVTDDYLATNPTIDGKKIRVELKPMGSGEIIDAILSGEVLSLIHI